jgi:hypothetical protein
MNSSSEWLYKIDGDVFGPISAQELLEELYEGEIDSNTPIATENSAFRPMSEYDVFKDHIKQAGSHRARAAEIKHKASLDSSARVRRRLGLWTVTALLAVSGFVATIYFVRSYRSEQVAEQEEAALEGQLAQLLDTVSIEPPLILESPKEKSSKRKAGKRRRRRTKSSAPSAPAVKRTGKLTQGEVMYGVGTVFGGFKNCIVRQIQRDRTSVPRKVTLRFTIGNDGNVKSPDLDDRILRKSPMMACMSKQIRSVKFRKFKGEVRNVEYPITIGAH